jgi:hypothetical protein
MMMLRCRLGHRSPSTRTGKQPSKFGSICSVWSSIITREQTRLEEVTRAIVDFGRYGIHLSRCKGRFLTKRSVILVTRVPNSSHQP